MLGSGVGARCLSDGHQTPMRFHSDTAYYLFRCDTPGETRCEGVGWWLVTRAWVSSKPRCTSTTSPNHKLGPTTPRPNLTITQAKQTRAQQLMFFPSSQPSTTASSSDRYVKGVEFFVFHIPSPPHLLLFLIFLPSSTTRRFQMASPISTSLATHPISPVDHALSHFLARRRPSPFAHPTRKFSSGACMHPTVRTGAPGRVTLLTLAPN